MPSVESPVTPRGEVLQVAGRRRRVWEDRCAQGCIQMCRLCPCPLGP